MGLMLPFVKSKHALIGACTGMGTLIWIVIRAQTDIALGVLQFETKKTSTEGCSYFFNSTMTDNSFTNESLPVDTAKPFHHISYMYYMPLGTMITIVVSVLASLVLHSDDPEEVEPQLLASFVRKWYAPKQEEIRLEENGNYFEKVYEFEKAETISDKN